MEILYELFNLNNNKIINIFEKLLFLAILVIIGLINPKVIPYNFELNQQYSKIQTNFNLTFNNLLNKKINIAIYYTSIKNGGIERLTALLIDYINNITIFNAFLLTKKGIEENEYPISKNIKRININGRSGNLLKIVKREKIDILIYHFYYHVEMISLNKLNNIKIIYYNHSCFLIWIYALFYYYFQTTYEVYRKSKYIISLVPFESDYLLKKWGINSILMSNFITYEYNLIIPSDLSSKTILMIGRGSDRLKRFELGVESMKYIIKEIPDCKMKIISDYFKIDYLFKLVDILKINNHIEFVGYTSIPEIYFKNASLHIFPSISESFGLVLSETKIFGIPNILVGLDYIVLSKGGTLIIYDDSPESIAKGAIKILTDDIYRKNLGKEARRSMKKFKNELLLKRWVKLILSVYNGYNYYLKLIGKDEKISKSEYNIILKRQLELLKKRIPNFSNITVENIENFTFVAYEMKKILNLTDEEN